ncbi:unnamed protein product [Effrenium voratum]|nr:unnamed protein product [Effrenium voratum]
MDTRRKRLVQEGIEPNPGPSAGVELSLATVNCGGAEAFQGVLSTVQARDEHPSVLACQETFLQPKNVHAAAAKLERAGYRAWMTVPRGHYRSGVLLAVSSLAAVKVSEYVGEAGEAVSATFSSLAVVSVWRCPSEPLLAYLDEVAFFASARGLQLAMLGASSDADHPLDFAPTRWSGNRAIDYGLLSEPLVGFGARFWAEAYGDHKAVHFCIRHRAPCFCSYKLAPTDRFSCPTGLGRAEDGNSTEVEWEWFNATIEDCYRQVTASAGDQPKAGVRPKGSGAFCVPDSDERLTGSRLGSYRERSLRKLLGRVRERNKQWAGGRRDDALEANISRTWPRSLFFHDWRHAERTVEQALLAETQANSRHSLRRSGASGPRSGTAKQGLSPLMSFSTKWTRANGVPGRTSFLAADLAARAQELGHSAAC